MVFWTRIVVFQSGSPVQGALLKAFKTFSLPRELILSAEFQFSFITEGTSTPRRRSRIQVLPAPIPQEASCNRCTTSPLVAD
jgi:hypothetical protein